MMKSIKLKASYLNKGSVEQKLYAFIMYITLYMYKIFKNWKKQGLNYKKVDGRKKQQIQFDLRSLDTPCTVYSNRVTEISLAYHKIHSNLF